MTAFSAVLLAALVLLSGGRSDARADGDFSEFAFRPHPGAYLPLVAELADEQGRAVPLGQYFNGKPVILVLDYLRCQTLCGVTLQNLVAALDALPRDAGRDFEVVVISIDPRDKPAEVEAAKVKYMAGYHHPRANDGWHFLIGSEGMVRSVADAVGFPHRYEAELDQYTHPAGFVVAAPDGTISRYLIGVDIHPTTLAAAVADAAQGRAIGLVERILLLCHGKDPNLGPYSLAIEGAFIIANLTAMAGGVAVFVAIWRRRHG